MNERNQRYQSCSIRSTQNRLGSENCPLLRSLEDDFSKERPFEGIRIALSIHLEAKTAYLCKVLAAGGAEMYITKPFSAEYLRISVCQVIERKEVLKNYFSSPISSFEKSDGKLTHKESKKFLQSV